MWAFFNAKIIIVYNTRHMDKPHTFIFVGRSGAGKGTQAQLLKEYLKDHSQAGEYSFVMGDVLRSFMKDTGYAQEVIRKTLNEGKLVPDAISGSMFVSTLLDNLKQEDDLYIDGIPRSVVQADIIISMLEFYNRTNTFIVNIEISPAEAEKRMLLRNRPDDTKESIASRFAFYEEHVVAAIAHLKEKSGAKYIDINGERSVEEIHADLIAQLEPML